MNDRNKNVHKYNNSLMLKEKNSLSLLLDRVKASTTILEFGPAYGSMTKYLTEELSCKVFAVEICKESASETAKYTEKIIVDDIENYTWLDEFKYIKFDYIIFADVLEHLRDPRTVLSKSKNLLKDNGSVLMSIPNVAHLSVIKDLIENKFEYRPEGILDETHLRFFTKSSINNLLEECALKPVFKTEVRLDPWDTEFKTQPDYITEFLTQEIKDENVYQFILEAKNASYVQNNNIKCKSSYNSSQKAYIYYDTGRGFNEQNKLAIKVKNNSFNERINLPANIKKLRFTPCKKHFCKCKIKKIETDGIFHKIQAKNTQINDSLGWNIFLSIDPFYILEGDFTAATFIRITGKIEPLSQVSISDNIGSLMCSYEQYKALYEQYKALNAKLNQQITELYEFAQSLRLKNRVKNIILLCRKMLHILKEEGIRSLIHRLYRKSLLRKKRTANLPLVKNKTGFNALIEKKEFVTLQESVKFDIIIPVYNGFDYLENLFKGIFKCKKKLGQIIIIDDFSTDDRVVPFIQKIIEQNDDTNFHFIKSNVNKGFVKTVNEAVKYTSNHFVLLNTDIELPFFWIDRLMHPIINKKNIASTTPFTNSGSICSFPNWIDDNDIFLGLDVDRLDKYFQHISMDDEFYELPTGVGFCMGFNKKVVNEIGMFDADVFGLGYGEENDWCMRATKRGYVHCLVSNLFVYHKHGGSFGSKRNKLIAPNLKRLNTQHPGYNFKIQVFIEEDSFKDLRDSLFQLIISKEIKTSIAYITNSFCGGATFYLDERIKKHLTNNELVLRMGWNNDLKVYFVEIIYPDFVKIFFYKTSKSLFEYISFLGVKEIFINTLVSFPEISLLIRELILIKNKEKLKITIPIHDYFCCCPRYTLLTKDKEGIYKYCKIPQDKKICDKCLQLDDFAEFGYNPKIVNNINLWRDDWRILFNASDKILCFSNDTKDRFISVYKNNSKIELIPHIVTFLKKKYIEKIALEGNYINIGILGAINFAKGLNIIKEMCKIIEREKLNIKITIIGYTTKPIKNNISVLGAYKRENLENIIIENKIDMFLIPSIWPETFSYTTQEIMIMDLPLAVFDIGAPAERIKKYNKGIIISEISAKAAIESILEFNKKR